MLGDKWGSWSWLAVWMQALCWAHPQPDALCPHVRLYFSALQLIYFFLITGHQIFLMSSHTPSTLYIFWMVYLNSNFQERTMSCAHHLNHIFCPHTFWLREKNVSTLSALAGNMSPFLWLTFYEYMRLTTPITTWEMPKSILWSLSREQSHLEKANKRNSWNNLYKSINIYINIFLRKQRNRV